MSAKFTNKIYSGDALKKIRYVKDNSIDLILTDPPYNLGLFMKNRSTNLSAMRENHFSGKKWDDLEESVWIENMGLLFQEFSRVLKKGGSLVVFMAIIKLESIIKIAEKNKFYYKTTGIWHKKIQCQEIKTCILLIQPNHGCISLILQKQGFLIIKIKPFMIFLNLV